MRAISAFAKQKRGYGSESRAVRLRGVGKMGGFHAPFSPCGNLFVVVLFIVRAVCCFLGGCEPPSRLRGGLKSIMGVLRPPIMLSAQGFLFVKPNT